MSAGDDFDWSDETDVVIREQPTTAIFRNDNGGVTIRQRQWPDDDGVVYFQLECLHRVIDRLIELLERNDEAPQGASKDPKGAERARRYRRHKRDGGVTVTTSVTRDVTSDGHDVGDRDAAVATP